MGVDLTSKIIAQESGGDSTAYNPATKATGQMQITPVFVKDVNRIGGRSYTLADMKDPAKARDAQKVWADHYYSAAEREKGRALTDREKLMMHHGGPDGWKRPNAGYWVDRKEGKVWMSNSRYADEAMMKGTGFTDADDPNLRFGISSEPRPADMPAQGVAFDWNNPVDSAFRMVDALGSTWEAAARQNPTIAALNAMNQGMVTGSQEEGYDIWGDLDGYEGYAKRFIGIESRNDANIIKRRIDQELQDRETLSRSGAMGVAASLATGILDPINFIPVGGAATTARVGNNILRNAGRVALAGASAGAISEAVLQNVQETRTWEEGAYNIAGATLLSGLLGAAIGGLAGKQLDTMAAAIEKDLDLDASAPAVAAKETVENAGEIIETPPASKVTKAPEPVLEDVGVDGPEIIRTDAPTMDELEGAYVDYGGIQGKLFRDESGAWYIDEGGTPVMVESGESGRVAVDIGIKEFPQVPKPGKMYDGQSSQKVVEPYAIVESNTYKESLAKLDFDPETSTVNIHGKAYTYERVNVNKKGETVSVTLRNAEGKEVTVRDKNAVHTIELQKEAWEYDRAGEPLADITPNHIQEAFDELPETDKSRSRAYAQEDTAGRSAEGAEKGAGKGKKAAGKEIVMDESAIINGEYRAWRLCSK
ncbi:MAG: hypothetical protein HGA87_01720 [Desulfobulbaceae bacterium]|nr:hypothetical protein [Desulfobulbaceae bacterium]